MWKQIVLENFGSIVCKMRELLMKMLGKSTLQRKQESSTCITKGKKPLNSCQFLKMLLRSDSKTAVFHNTC